MCVRERDGGGGVGGRKRERETEGKEEEGRKRKNIYTMYTHIAVKLYKHSEADTEGKDWFAFQNQRYF